MGDIHPFKMNAARGNRSESHHRQGCSGLTRAGLTDNSQCPAFENIKGNSIHCMNDQAITLSIAFTQWKMDLKIPHGKYGSLLCVTHSLSRIANMMCIASHLSDSGAGNYPSICPSRHCNEPQKDTHCHDPKPKVQCLGFLISLGALRLGLVLIQVNRQSVLGCRGVWVD